MKIKIDEGRILVENDGFLSKTTIQENTEGSSDSESLVIHFSGSLEPEILMKEDGTWGRTARLTITGHGEVEEFLATFESLIKNRK